MGKVVRERLGRTWRAAAAVAVLASVFGCCALAQSAQDPYAAPKNYRQLVAAKIRHMEDVKVLQSVEITPLQRGGWGIWASNRPTVCVTVRRPNIFGMTAAWYYLFYFENGQVHGHKQMPSSAFEMAMVQCRGPMTPITNLVRARR